MCIEIPVVISQIQNDFFYLFLASEKIEKGLVKDYTDFFSGMR